MNYTIGEMLILNGENEIDSGMVVVEVADCNKTGEVEFTFQAEGMKGSLQIYLRVRLPEVLQIVMKGLP